MLTRKCFFLEWYCRPGHDFVCFLTSYPNLRSVCVANDQVCNGWPDCPNGEDEQNCVRPPQSKRSKLKVTCPKPASLSVLCSGCYPGQFQCGDGSCVDQSRICDGRFDCVDAADERDCSVCREPEEFACESGQCVAAGKRCDGIRDCRDGDDELDCPQSKVIRIFYVQYIK